MVVKRAESGEVLAGAVRRASGFTDRLFGLMFRTALGPGEGLWISPCRAVHTHFMRFPIDVIFLDRAGRVIDIVRGMRPWRQSRFVQEADSVLELAANGAAWVTVGERLVIE